MLVLSVDRIIRSEIIRIQASFIQGYYWPIYVVFEFVIVVKTSQWSPNVTQKPARSKYYV